MKLKYIYIPFVDAIFLKYYVHVAHIHLYMHIFINITAIMTIAQPSPTVFSGKNVPVKYQRVLVSMKWSLNS